MDAGEHEWGEIVMQRHEDGTTTVVSSDATVAISTFLLNQIEPDHINADGLFVADAAGEYRYRPIRFAMNGRVVVCERVA